MRLSLFCDGLVLQRLLGKKLFQARVLSFQVLQSPYFRHSSFTGMPASASSRKPRICSSVKRFFTSNLLRLRDWTPNYGATQNWENVARRIIRPRPLTGGLLKVMAATESCMVVVTGMRDFLMFDDGV